MGHLNQSVWDFTTVVLDTLAWGYVFLQVYSYLVIKFGYYEKATKFEKIFHVKFDVTK